MNANEVIKNNDLKLFLNYFSQRHDFNQKLFMHLYRDTDEEAAIKILAYFNENLKDCSEKIKAACRDKNCETALKAIHKISGSAELLGFKSYSDKSSDLTRRVRFSPVFDDHISEIESYLKNTMELNYQITINFPTLSSFL